MNLVDTHAHINLHAFQEDADEVVRRALEAGVAMINVGTEYRTSKQVVDMLDRFEQSVFAAVGLHPSHTYDNPYLDENESAFGVAREEFDFEAYKQLGRHEKVVGIGECGLDYYRLPEDVSLHQGIKTQQQDAFRRHIQLAHELNKTLIIHCRPSQGTEDAYVDVLRMLDDFSRQKSRLPRFEIHSFTGSVAVARTFLELGGYIGVNGIITFDKTGNMEQVVKGVPLDRIVLETDSPYLAPAPFRGKRNEPLYVAEVARKIASLAGVAEVEVATRTTENAKALFSLAL